MALVLMKTNDLGFNFWLIWPISIIICIPLWIFFHNIFLHPLRKFPGPMLARGSNWIHFYWIFSGKLHYKMLDLHSQYGDVVRIAPNLLVYNGTKAWKDICGHRKAGAGSFDKDMEFYPIGPSGHSIISANNADHTRERRLLAHAFSEKALRDQESLIQSYVDLLISKLREQANAVDITKWYNYTTFDIIGDLSFGEPFNCLETSSYHAWVDITFQSIKSGALMRPFLVSLPLTLLKMFLPNKLKERREVHFRLSKEKVRRRVKLETTRPDFIAHILRHNSDDERSMTQRELEANAGVLIAAGSETTATLLSGFTFYVLTNRDVYEKLVGEIRGVFRHHDDIGFLSVAKLQYLNATLEESLRMYPPIPGVLPRKVPQGGAVIDGQFVPGGTTVSMAYLSSFRSESNFTQPDSFIPERWLPDGNPRFASDKKEALQPFSYGPRNCLGKNLAYAEMRLIAAKLLWNFDLTLQKDSYDWNQQTSYTVWQKGPLMVKLTPIRSDAR